VTPDLLEFEGDYFIPNWLTVKLFLNSRGYLPGGEPHFILGQWMIKNIEYYRSKGLYVKFFTPKGVMKQAGKLYSRVIRCKRLVFIKDENTDEGGTLQYFFKDDITAYKDLKTVKEICEMNRGVFHDSLAQTFYSEVAVNETKCFHNDGLCEYEVKWGHNVFYPFRWLLAFNYLFQRSTFERKDKKIWDSRIFDLKEQLALKKEAEDALKRAYDDLEDRVAERTTELSKAGVLLRKEIAERMHAEEALKKAYETLQSTQAQLIQSAKLASIGELAAGVAHELNQPLMVIRSTAQFIERDAKNERLDRDKLIDLLRDVERNTKRMMNTISHLRVFSRQSSKDFSAVDVNRVIEDCFLMVGEQLRVHNIEIRKTLEPMLPKILGDANQLEQVFLNQITNARDALEQREQDEGANTEGESRNIKTIEILTRVSEDDKDNLEILIKDTGGGIQEENMGKIFDPFFTTKEIGKGTGLGLSISYGIIKDHQGEIEVAETGPQGTTFRIRLPISKSNEWTGERG